MIKIVSKILEKTDGTYESMVQRMYRKVREVDSEESVTIAILWNQVASIHSQHEEDVGISVETCEDIHFL